MKLFGTPRSPFARRVRVALLNSGIPFNWEVLTLQEIFPPSERLLRLSPLGLVPVLETAEGNAVPDSSEILSYIDSYLCPLWPREERLNIAARRISALAAGVLTYAVREFQGLRVASPLDGQPESNVDLIVRTLDCLEREVNGPEILKPPSSLKTAAGANQAGWDCAIALDYLDFRMSEKVDWRAGRSALGQLFQNTAEHPHFISTAPVI